MQTAIFIAARTLSACLRPALRFVRSPNALVGCRASSANRALVRPSTTRRAFLPVLLLAGILASPGGAGTGAVPRLIFPVVGAVSYRDDFGEPRGTGRHQGNDLLAAKRSPAVAVESGTVTFWTKSVPAGCMLYLRGDSGTMYLYIHLNNDLTAKNDNRGKCVPGVAYAKGLADGDRVAGGEPVGLVGNSGDADATAAHLHFEVHPRGGAAVSPYAYLRKARKLLFSASLGSLATLKLRGTLVAAPKGTLRMRVETLRRWPGGLSLKPGRVVDLSLPSIALVVDAVGDVVEPAALATAKAGMRITVTTDTAPVTLKAALGAPRALTARAVVLD
jgi:hypothetical protein